jgi:hypothetical protein
MAQMLKDDPELRKMIMEDPELRRALLDDQSGGGIAGKGGR